MIQEEKTLRTYIERSRPSADNGNYAIGGSLTINEAEALLAEIARLRGIAESQPYERVCSGCGSVVSGTSDFSCVKCGGTEGELLSIAYLKLVKQKPTRVRDMLLEEANLLGAAEKAGCKTQEEMTKWVKLAKAANCQTPAEVEIWVRQNLRMVEMANQEDNSPLSVGGLYTELGLLSESDKTEETENK